MSIIHIPDGLVYSDLYTLSGIEPGKSLVITSNSSLPVFILQQQFQPSNGAEGVPLIAWGTTVVHGTVDPIWIRGSSGPVTVQEITGTIVPFIGVDLPQDIYTNKLEGLRRPKISSEPSIAAAILNGFAYTVSGSFSIANNTLLAMNLSPASDIIIHKIVTDSGLPIDVYDELANGVADGIFSANNMNLLSIDSSPAQGQLYSAAVPAGSIIASGITTLEPYIICGLNNKIAAVVKNTTGATATIKITITFEEIGPRSSSFGLTASTSLTPTTEMSTYG